MPYCCPHPFAPLEASFLVTLDWQFGLGSTHDGAILRRLLKLFFDDY